MDHNRLIKMDLIVIYSFQLLHINFFSLNNNNRRKKNDNTRNNRTIKK